MWSERTQSHSLSLTHLLGLYSIVTVAMEKTKAATKPENLNWLCPWKCSFHISVFYSFIWPGIRWNKCTPKHKVADRMRLFHPGKNFSGGKVEEYTETLGPFIAVSVKLLIKPTGNHCQGTGCTRTEKWPFFLATKILKCEVGVFPKTQKCFISPPLGQRLNDGRTFLPRKNSGQVPVLL